MIGIPRKIVEQVKAEYPKETRVELLRMLGEERAPKAGTQGTVLFVDSMATIHVKWDDGSCFGVVYGIDKCRKI